jgi:hypothetical protein
MNNEQQQIIDEVYKNYLSKAKNYTTEELFYNKLSGEGDVIEGMLSAHTRDFIPYSQEEFIDKCKTDPEFSEKWRLKIDERIKMAWPVFFPDSKEIKMFLIGVDAE